MRKIDYKKKFESVYKQPAKEISIVDVPEFQFLLIDGTGDPNNNPEYSSAVEALYALAYALKFKIKKSSFAVDYAVMPLEGLWWADDMKLFQLESRENWKWTMMIMQPEFITDEMVQESITEVRKKKNPSQLSNVRFSNFQEGHCAQIFHKGPYGKEEIPTIKKLHDFILENGYQLRDKHHEIYFNSLLRTNPENLRTIIRQPIK
jgi:hypothetical protein